MILKAFRKIKIILFKIIIKSLKSIFKNNYPPIIRKIITYTEYIEFFTKRENFKSLFINQHSDGEWIIENLNKNGFCIIENFWSEEDCIKGINSINSIIRKYPDYVQTENKSDSRVYGAENISRNINNFAKDKLLLSVADQYNRKKSALGFTLAARMPSTYRNKGSGEGWHRDGFYRQFKTLLYLSDVGNDNGPFQLILNSQKYKNLIQDMKSADLKYMQYRLTDEEIKKILFKEPQRKKTILGNMGTLILVDTSTLHRGAPIKKGIRYALTNYYYTYNQIDEKLYKKFKVIPKDIITNNY